MSARLVAALLPSIAAGLCAGARSRASGNGWLAATGHYAGVGTIVLLASAAAMALLEARRGEDAEVPGSGQGPGQ